MCPLRRMTRRRLRRKGDPAGVAVSGTAWRVGHGSPGTHAQRILPGRHRLQQRIAGHLSPRGPRTAARRSTVPMAEQRTVAAPCGRLQCGTGTRTKAGRCCGTLRSPRCLASAARPPKAAVHDLIRQIRNLMKRINEPFYSDRLPGEKEHIRTVPVIARKAMQVRESRSPGTGTL